MTTPSDDEILAAARDAGIILYRDVLGTERWRCDCIRTKLFALYRAAYAAGMRAGMERSAGIADAEAKSFDRLRRFGQAEGAVCVRLAILNVRHGRSAKGDM